MKKLLALLLATIMCTSLVACGEKNSPEKAVLGTWFCQEEYDTLTFEAEGKLTRGDETLDWWYDDDGQRYCLSYYGMTFNFVIQEDEKGRFFTIEDMPYYYMENYDPEEIRAQKIAELIDGKTEMVVGNTYTTEDGVQFVFEKAGIAGEETDCMFELYLTSEGNLNIQDEHYESDNGWSGFGLGNQGTEGNTTRFAGGFMQLDRLKEDKEDYGFLSFTVNGTPYYVSIEAFF